MSNEEKILSILETMQIEQHKTNERLDRLEHKVDGFASELAGVKRDLGEVKSDLVGVKRDLGEVKSDLAGVKRDLGEVKSDLAGVKRDLGEAKSDLAGVKRDLAGVKHEQAGMKLELAEIKDTLEDVFEHAVRLTEQQTVIQRSIKDLTAVTEVNTIDIVKLRAAR